ncbi:recombinase family protein [Agrobacterium sp. ST15.13.015]|jgi:putative DNA-invertase from lambdoid prophage Rac|uniref:recombinase family protein n=1 Tax=Agrobacterium sp. ST15.13.015 TaxID=3017319 RepID=UPI0022BB7900|nr:recombinase family protein [Agrobacterium sp. ST15.13.015]MCZ7502989.1 recombinase family protein [Rhizobium rhizogenes]
MSRIFAYVRVSTVGQSAENQIAEIERAGFNIMPRRIVSETISGSTPVAQRPGFLKLLDRLEPEDVLIVTKLDRLGRDAMDVSSTVKMLAENGVRVHCLQLGGLDLTSSAGTMTMHILNAMAQFERDLLIERTQAGVARAREKGKRFGRPPALTDRQVKSAKSELAEGVSVSALARKHGVSRQTIARLKVAPQDAAPGDVE